MLEVPKAPCVAVIPAVPPSWTKGIPCLWPPCLLAGTWRVQLLQVIEAVLPPHLSAHTTMVPTASPSPARLWSQHIPFTSSWSSSCHEVVMLSWQEVCSLRSRTYLRTTLKERDKGSAQPLHPVGQQAFWQVFAVLGGLLKMNDSKDSREKLA